MAKETMIKSPIYIKAVTFQDFCKNQEKLIGILNHRMTKIEEFMMIIKNDVSWTKKILWSIFTVAVASFLTMVIKVLLEA